MFLQEGDKVSFLNEKREGIIRRFINARMASVEIEDGFEIPVAVNELVKILPGNMEKDAQPHSEQTISQSSEKNHYKETPEEIKTETGEDISDFVSPLAKAEKNKEGIYLSFKPAVQDEFPGSEIHLGLINHTLYDLLFACYYKQEDSWNAHTYDACPPLSQYFLKSIPIAELVQWESFRIQVIFYNADGGSLKSPLDKEIPLKAGRYFREGAFAYSPVTESKCILLPFYEEITPEVWPEEEWIAEKINPIPLRNIKELTQGNNAISTLPKKHIVAPYIAEVDLHIEQLADDTRNLGNHDKLNIQLEYFSKCLDAAIVHKFKKITFIHGVGQGRLKDEIHKVISESYPGVKIQDAPFKKYGMGATEVLIPFNLTR